MKKKNTLIIVAGANGSGKSTFAQSYMKKHQLDFINADEIVNQFPHEGYSKYRIKAGKIYFEEIQSLLQQKKSLIIESTLSGKTLLNTVKGIKQQGYLIKILYQYLDDPKLCIQRIRERIMKGGHPVPDEDVIRRYYRSTYNFWTSYRQLADFWLLMNNSGRQYQNMVFGSNEHFVIKNKLLFNRFIKQFQED